mgnify:CR=1 FL=1
MRSAKRKGISHATLKWAAVSIATRNVVERVAINAAAYIKTIVSVFNNFNPWLK